MLSSSAITNASPFPSATRGAGALHSAGYDGVSNTQENENPFLIMIELFSRLRNLTQKLMILEAEGLNERIDITQALTDEASHLAAKYAALKDDDLWDWKADPRMQEIIKLMKDLNIKVDGKPVEEWLESVEKTKGSETGIPKYQLLVLGETLRAAATKEKDTSTQSQTQITQLSQTLQNYISAVTNMMTVMFRTLANIISNWKG